MALQGDELQQLIDSAESVAGKWLVARVMLGIGLAADSVWFGPVHFLVVIAVGIIVRYGDVLGFMLVSKWHDTAEGQVFQQAAEALNNLSKDASDAERQAAELAAMQAFAALQNLGTLPDGGTVPPSP